MSEIRPDEWFGTADMPAPTTVHRAWVAQGPPGVLCNFDEGALGSSEDSFSAQKIFTKGVEGATHVSCREDSSKVEAPSKQPRRSRMSTGKSGAMDWANSSSGPARITE